MLARRAALFAIVGLAFVGQSAFAFLDPPYLTPLRPTPSDTVAVNVYGGQCDVLNGGVVPVQITQQGSNITIGFFGAHETDPISCIYGVGTYTYPVGVYPEGSYTLTVLWSYFGGTGRVETQTLGVVPFTVSETVAPAAPVPAPALGWLSAAVLVALVMAASRRSLRRRSMAGEGTNRLRV